MHRADSRHSDEELKNHMEMWAIVQGTGSDSQFESNQVNGLLTNKEMRSQHSSEWDNRILSLNKGKMTMSTLKCIINSHNVDSEKYSL